MKRLPSLLLAAALVATTARAETYSFQINSSAIASSGVVTFNSITATMAYTWQTQDTYFSTSGGMAQIGSGSNPVYTMSITIPANSFTKPIASVMAKARGARGVHATVSVKVGGVSYECGGLTAPDLTTNATSYEFTPAATAQNGDIVITFLNSANTAIYTSDFSISTILSPLLAPQNLSTPSVAGYSFSLAWNPVPHAAGYTVTLYDATETVVIDTQSCSASDTSAMFTGLTPLTSYVASVVALGDNVDYADSPAATSPVTTLDASTSDPPVLMLSTSEQSVSPGYEAGCSVTANKPVNSYDIVGIDSYNSTIDPTEYSFDEATGIFSFTPEALGRYQFSFTATDANGTSDPVVFTVWADTLPSPQNLTASNIGNTSFTASWDAVTGADNYDVALLAKTTALFTFEYASTGIGSTWATPTGDADLLTDRILWHAANEGARFYVDDSYDANNHRKGDQQIDGLSLTIKAGQSLGATFGPFPNGVYSIAFDYVWAQETASSGHIRVYIDDQCIGNSTASPAHLVDMAQPSQTVQHFAYTLDPPFDGYHTVRIACTTSPVVIDNVAITSYGTVFPLSQISSNSTVFTGLTPATDHIFSVKATGYGYAGDVESDTSVSDVVTTLGNHAPTLELSATSAAVHAGEPVSVTLIGADADGDVLSYIVWPGTYDTCLVDNVFTWTPTTVGTTEFQFAVSDGTEITEPITFTVTADLAEPAVTATVADSASATLSWDSVVGASSYRVSATGTSVKGTTVLAESFDKFPGELTTGSTSTADETPDAYMTLPGWTLTKVFRGDNTGSQQDLGISSNAVRVGTTSTVGSLTSPALDLSGNGGAFVVVFDARRFQAANPKRTITVTAGNATETVTLADTMTTHIVSFPAGTGTAATTIRIGGVNGDNRFFLDNLKVVSGTAAATTVDAANLAVSGTTCAATGLMPFSFYTFTVTAVTTVDGAEVTASALVAVETPEAPSATLILIH